jgi:hypothetical protein
LAYANAWPDALVWDDTVFAAGSQVFGLNTANFRSFFVDDVWVSIGSDTGIYRPLLLLSVALNVELFGNWAAGFHLFNILLHVLVCLAVYGLIRHLLLVCGSNFVRSSYIALLAALVFAVHPVHTEAVNSIFNRSEMLVSLCMAGGLWWFLETVENRPWIAWILLGLIYFVAMLCRETGIVMPAITVVFLWVITSGSWQARLSKCLPVVWLLIPMAIYLGMRASALEVPFGAAEMAVKIPAEVAQSVAKPEGDAGNVVQTITESLDTTYRQSEGDHNVPLLGLVFNLNKILPAVTVWFDSLILIIWPDPLLTFRNPTQTSQWLALSLQAALFAVSIFWLFQKSPGLFLGLTFFYLTMLPASRIIGEHGIYPHVAERYLYMPSIGITITFAFALIWMARRFTFKAAVIPVLLALIALTPLTWSRNTEWASTKGLAEADFRNGSRSGVILRTLVKSLFAEGQMEKAAEVCDKNSDRFLVLWYLAGNCAQVYATLGRFESAEQAYLTVAKSEEGRSSALFYLAVMYLSQDRREEAIKLFKQAILEERHPYLKEFRTAEMLVELYPSDRKRLREAKKHLEKSLELEPNYHRTRVVLMNLDRFLSSTETSTN